MRKAQRQQAETLFGQLEEAHIQIKSDVEQHHIEQALDLLKDCQDSCLLYTSPSPRDCS